MAESNIKREIAYKTRVSHLHMGSYVKQEGWLPNYVQLNDGRKASRINIVGTIIDVNLSNELTQDTIIIDDGSANMEVRDFEGTYLKNCTKGSTVLIIGKIKEYNGLKYILPEIVKPLNDPKWILLRNLEHEYFEKTNDFDNKYLKKYDSEDANEQTTDQKTNQMNTVESNTVATQISEDNLIEEEDLSGFNIDQTKTQAENSINDEKAPLNNYSPKFKNDYLDEFDKIKEPEPVKETLHIQIINFIRSKDGNDGVPVEIISSKFENSDGVIEELLKEGEVFEIKPGILKVLE